MQLVAFQTAFSDRIDKSEDTKLHSLIKDYDALVRQIARTVSYSVSAGVEIDDLVQVGIAALISASRTFVDRGEACFSTYARTRIRGAMIDETRKLSTLSRGVLRQRRELNALRNRLSSELGRQPSNAEVAEAAGMSLTRYMQAIDMQQSVHICSLDDSYADNNPYFTDQSPQADSCLEFKMSSEALAEAISTLPERQRTVLQLYFVEECGLAEIGEILNVGESRVCQIKKAALIALRCKVAGWA
ncbi:sigma-70 family RNA polymerase sigma factor [Sandarakinorhabdus oryzae]|uniref:sigma-70 family RNA polymerase sigma factor n=1 Tax=Sandarakinorhabdus oryzae TaxID=2675220 RepID=UPI0012E11517|nr:FliA/WhiG family RNA polymerase sigma factor [Sandarakinorhabdus oryzae]